MVFDRRLFHESNFRIIQFKIVRRSKLEIAVRLTEGAKTLRCK